MGLAPPPSSCPPHTHTHTQISKAAKDHKKFADYNSRCIIHHKSKAFAERLCLLVKAIDERVPIKTLSFLGDACQLLVQSHKVRYASRHMTY